MSEEVNQDNTFVKKMKPKGRGYNFGKLQGKRYFNVKEHSTKKESKRFENKSKGEFKKPKKVDQDMDRYQSHLPETPGYVDLDLSTSEREQKHRTKVLALTQDDILKHSDLVSASKRFELKLPKLGPYHLNYSRSGRYLLIGGSKGHVASIDWMSKKLACEFQLKETVRALHFLHNENMFAIAQKKYLYIYDKQGVELHCLKAHHKVCALDFLPYHFLLVSVNKKGFLQYLDTSTGESVANFCTRLGRTNCLTHNPNNGIVHVGHSNGAVTLWSPKTPEPLVKMLCHHGPVKSVVIDNSGQYMISGGVDSKVRIWDVRTYKSLGEIRNYAPADAMRLSQRNILAIASGRRITTYHEPFSHESCAPYLKHYCDDAISSIEFCPYEDVLGIGHGLGFSSILIPGSGEPNIDSLEANPYQTKSQKREHEVKMLLEKIQPELITLRPDSIKKVADLTGEELEKMQEKQVEAGKAAKREEYRKRGKSGAIRQFNTMEKRAKRQEFSFAKQRQARQDALQRKRKILEGDYQVLDRFK